MKNRILLRIAHDYLNSYSGIPGRCWNRIVLSFFNDFSTGFIFFISLYFVKYLNFSVVNAGLIISAYGIGRVIGGYTGGRLSDNISPTMISCASIFVESIMLLLLIKIRTMELLLCNMFILGFCAYSFRSSNNFWILENSNDKLKAMNVLYIFSNMGIGLSALALGFFENHGFILIFAICGFLNLGVAIFLLITSAKCEVKNQRLEKTYNLEESKDDVKLIKSTGIISFLLLSCLFFIGMVVSQRGVTYNLFIHQNFPEFGIQGVGFLFSINPILILVFQAPLIKHFNNHNKLLIMSMGALLIGIGTIILGYFIALGAVIISSVIYTFGEMFFFSVAQLAFYQRARNENKGKTIGIFQMTYALSLIAGPAIGVFAYHYFGGSNLWLLCGTVSLLSAMFCLLAVHRNSHASPYKRRVT